MQPFSCLARFPKEPFLIAELINAPNQSNGLLTFCKSGVEKLTKKERLNQGLCLNYFLYEIARNPYFS
jgi:hypothetical protein